MKILFIGKNYPYSIETMYMRNILAIGKEVDMYNIGNKFDLIYNKSILNKILYRIIPSFILSKLNKDLLNHIQNKKPDIILVFKGMEVLPSTIIAIRNMGIPIANYNLDHPFQFTGRGSGNANITKSIGLYDVHFSYHYGIIAQLNHKFPHISTQYLPFGYEISPKQYAMAIQEKELVKIAFIGYADQPRADFIQSFCNAGLAVDVFGNNWGKYFSNNSLITIYPSVYTDNLWITLRRYRVQLNIFREHNAGSHNMRSFEVPAIGGIMVAPDSTEHRMFFEDKKEVFLYKNTDEAIEIARKLLALPAADADIIRQAARLRSVTDGNSYAHRAQTIIDTLQRIIHKNT